MRVTTISASIRYSKSLEPREHKTVELSAEASLDPGDDWSVAQQELYTSLTAQLKTLWSKNGIVTEHAPDGPRTAIEPGSWEQIEARPSPKGHYCSEHQAEFRRFEKDGRHWYSHKHGDAWCKEQPVLRGWRND